jgi:DNA replication and repair protein RecF
LSWRVKSSFETASDSASEGHRRSPGVSEGSRASQCAPLAVTRLALSNFRSYAFAELSMSGRCVVLAGPNGAGKTNLLDALSLLTPGRGLRGATLAEHIRKGPSTVGDPLWAVSATVNRGSYTHEIGSGLSAGASGAARQVRLNGASPQGSADLSELMPMVWLTPAMDRLFVEGGSGRRRFLDRLTLGFDSCHGQRSLRYEQAMRERARLLKFGPRDPAWLDGLERQMAENGVAIAESRASAVEQLNEALRERRAIGSFPCAQLAMRGPIDDLIGPLSDGNQSTLAIQTQLAADRMRDAEAGRTGFGPHLSDLEVRHTEKRADARECSTGEQKALLVSIVLAHARRLSHISQGLVPILLLDEIVAHLDAVRRAALFDEILSLGAQAWMTGTDFQMFSPLEGKADLFEVVDSQVRLISE